MTTVRVAVWGIGPHAERKILPAIVATPGLELIGVCSRHEPTARAAAARHSCLVWLDSVQMLADSRVDVVYVSTPIGLHAGHSLQVLHAGKHAWCEKPVATSLAEARTLVVAAQAGDRVLGEAFMFLYHPHFTRTQELIREGRLGRILSVSTRFGIPPMSDPRFRGDPALGGGAFLDLAPYTVATWLALLPSGETSVEFARITRRAGSAVDTDGHAILRAVDAAEGHLEWRIDSAYRNELFVWGEEGSLSTDLIYSKPATYEPVLVLRDRHGTETIERVRAADHFVDMLGYFRTMIFDEPARRAECARIEARARLLDEIQERAEWE